MGIYESLGFILGFPLLSWLVDGVVNFMSQLGQSQYPDVWSNASLDVSVKVFFPPPPFFFK